MSRPGGSRKRSHWKSSNRKAFEQWKQRQLERALNVPSARGEGAAPVFWPGDGTDEAEPADEAER